MAITAKAYGAFLTDLGSAVHDFTTGTYKVALLQTSYSPNYDTHASYTDVSGSELSTSGTGYTSQTLTGLSFTYDSAADTAKLAANSVSWTALTATAHYAVVYKSSNTNANSKLVGLIDFGADRTYDAEPFQLSFPNGVLTIASL